MTSSASRGPLKVVEGGQSGPDAPGSRSISVSPDLVMLSDPLGAAAESIRHLRTRIIAQHLERGRRAIALCSVREGTGCSFIAANLAIAFAQIGTRVLLADADMRGRGLDEMFGEAAAGVGFVQYLSSGDMNPHRITEQEILPNLSFTPAGGIAPNAQELLSSARFETFINQCLREFDLTIVDTPPSNVYADGQRIAAIAGYAVIIGRRHRTYFNDVSELSRQLSGDGVSVVGTVLNDY